MCQYSRVLSELVEVVVHIERVCLSQMNKFLQSFVDKDDADEGSEGFLCESCNVTHQRAGVCGNQHKAQEGRPQANASAQREVGQIVVTVERQIDMLYMLLFVKASAK